MDHFGRENLKELFDAAREPSISIYMPTVRRGSEVAAQPLRLRAALEEARELLAERDGGDVAATLEPFERLIDADEFWQHQADGLAAFAADGFHRVYRLPAQVPELVVVGPTFHTRPLLEMLQAPDRYWVLVLAQKRVQLWEGTASGVRPVDLGPVPESLEAVAGHRVEKEMLQMHSTGGHGNAPMFHGHGEGKDDAKPELVKFFRQVDAGLRELLGDEIGPVVLAAVGHYHPIYREVSRLENLAPEGIRQHAGDWDADRLHEAAWPIARQVVEQKLERARELWERSYGRGKVEQDVAAAARLAVAGRIRLLLTERERRVWGHLDPATGEVEILHEGGSDPGDQAVDLLDEIAELTIQHGGRALVLSAERMPTGTGLAAVLR